MARVENWERHFRAMHRNGCTCPGCANSGNARKPSRANVDYMFGSDSFGGTLIAADLVAINKYIHETTAVTPQAAALASDWAKWWITTGDPDNYFFLIPDEVLDEARNRRNAFNRANVTSPEELKKVNEVIQKGMSREAMRGEPERKDPITGDIFVPPPPPTPIIPKWVIPAAAVGVLVLVGAPVVKKLLFPIL